MATITSPAAVGGGGATVFVAGRFRDEGPPDYPTRLRRARLGMSVAVIGIGMIFVSLTSAYVVRQGLPTLDPNTGQLVHDWFALPLPRLLLVNTFVLLFSSLTMEMSRRRAAQEAALAREESTLGVSFGRAFRLPWLGYTIVFGLCFLAGQWLAWRQLAARGFYISTSPSSSFFYLLTGMHGLHLICGVAALLVAGGANVLRKPADTRAVILDVAGWYWHFMALLWVFIFFLLKFAR